MKKLKNSLLGLILCVTVLTIGGYSIFSQPPGGPPPGGGGGATSTVPPCWNPPCIPIDGGIGFLLAAGAFVGARKIYRGTRG